MSITIDTLREISLPFPSFQPNTIISSEQVNDNNDEIQYRTNLLIKSYLKHVLSTKEFEDTFNAHVQTYNTFVTETSENFVDVRRVADENKTYLKNYIDTINTALTNRITNEVETLNTLIATNKKQINDKTDLINSDLNSKINKKGDALEIRNTLLYLKSGNTTLSVADLAGLGGGTGKIGSNIASGQPVNKADWTLDEEKQLYYIIVEHRLNTSTPLVSYFNDETCFNIFDVLERVDANSIKVFNDTPVDTYISVINGSSKIELVQALLDDDNVTPLRTWSSEKILDALSKINADSIILSNGNSIDKELSIGTNSSYQTVNGLKEFECKDGYVDNILVGGKTLTNVFNGRAFFAVDCEKDAFIKLTNTKVTLFNFSDKQISYITSQREGSLTVKRVITVNPKESVLETILDDEYLWTVRGYTASGWSESLLNDFNNSVCAIQGDYTNTSISYFDGLKSVGQGDKIEILTCGNQMSNISLHRKTYTSTNDGTYDSVYGNTDLLDSRLVSDLIPIDISKSSIVGYVPKGYVIAFHMWDKNQRFLQDLKWSIDGNLNYNLNNMHHDTNFITVYLRKNPTSPISDEEKTMLESSIKIYFKQDKKQILTTLRSLPNGIKDTVEKRGNKYYKIQRCGEVTLNGDESWSSDSSKWNSTTVKPFVAGAIPNAKVNGNNLNIFCNNFKPSVIHSETITIEGIYYSSGLNIHVRFYKGKLSTQDLNGIKKWLNKNPITVVYELAEPIITELPNLNLRTFSPQTTLFVDSGAIQADISFEVTNTLGSSIDAIADKIGSLENMMSGQFEIGTESINNLLRKING